MPSRQRLGVLNAAHDLLKHLGHKLKPFLPEMCALVLTLLEGAPLAPSLQVMPCPALPCPALPCPALPCLALPCPGSDLKSVHFLPVLTLFLAAVFLSL